MALYSLKPLEREQFNSVNPLGSDRSVFVQLEERWRNLRAVRRLVLLPITVLGSVFPFVYVAIWSTLQNTYLTKDIEWWIWVGVAVATGVFWLWIAWRPYHYVKKREEEYDEALDALDALDYHNEYLVELSTGRRVSQLNHLHPLTEQELAQYGQKSQQAGPFTSAMWARWIQSQTPIRVCDLFVLEKMILKERWGALS